MGVPFLPWMAMCSGARPERPSFRIAYVTTLTTLRMMRPLFLTIAIATVALHLAACDDGTQDETAGARSRDSSLASDLRLARGDTARPADSVSIPPMVESSGGAASNAGTTRVVSNDAATTMMESSGSIGSTRSDSSSSVSAEGFVGPSCASPALLDQRRCLTSYLARSDVALDHNYQSLITALEREAGTQPGGREPPTVLRLRTAQRNWLIYRDDECRRRGAGTEGPLWAPTRATCLAEYSDQRSQELANALSGRLAAQTAAKPATSRSVSKTVTRTKAKHAKATKRSRRHRR